MCFHIVRSEGSFETDAESLEICLSDSYYVQDVERIRPEPTQDIPPGSNPGQEHQSHVEASSESTSLESEQESSDTDKSKDSVPKGNPSGEDRGNAEDGPIC